MKQGLGLVYFVVFKTTAPDNSAYFGITRTLNPTHGADGEAITYYGNGPRLIAKVKQFGIERLRYEVLQVYGTYEGAENHLKSILNDATLADPMCLNMPRPHGSAHGAKVSAGLTDIPKSQDHRLSIGESMVGNDNATGHVKDDNARHAISEARSKVKWFHNKKTGEEIQLEPDEDVLTNFEIGRLPKEYASNFKKDRKAAIPPHLKEPGSDY